MKTMNKSLVAVSLSAVLAVTAGCTALENTNKTQRGAGGGAAAGALLGQLIGGNTKSTMIGAAIGGVAGGIIGNNMDKQADAIQEAVPGAEVKRVGESIQIIFDENSGVNFAFNSSSLTPQAKANLDQVAEVFREFPDTNLLLEGHTDSTGDANYNMTLSQQRAQAVADYLKAKGVGSNRFTVQAFGETKPRFDNSTKEGQAGNRRVEVVVAANEDMINDAKAQAR
jgi:outer membrane protein OmpA-like peptidoglycan-associated protein